MYDVSNTKYYNLINKNNKLQIDYFNTLSIDDFLVFLDTPKTILRTYQVEGEIRKKQSTNCEAGHRHYQPLIQQSQTTRCFYKIFWIQ